jgi:hypothetical protein
MPPGEEMFKYHGYSGPCPKPAIAPKAVVGALIEYVLLDDALGFWLEIWVDRKKHETIGPFDTAGERQRVHDDLLSMMRSLGAKDLPVRTN